MREAQHSSTGRKFVLILGRREEKKKFSHKNETVIGKVGERKTKIGGWDGMGWKGWKRKSKKIISKLTKMKKKMKSNR